MKFREKKKLILIEFFSNFDGESMKDFKDVGNREEERRKLSH